MVFFYVVHIAVCVLLIATILFQEGKAGGLVSVADSSQSVFGAKGASSFLTKMTAVLAVLFMVLSFALAYSSSPSNKSIASDYSPPPEQPGGTPALTPGGGIDTNNQVEFTDPVTGEKRLGNLGEAIKDFEVVTDPNELPEDLRIEREESLRELREEAVRQAREDSEKKKQEAEKAEEKKDN